MSPVEIPTSHPRALHSASLSFARARVGTVYTACPRRVSWIGSKMYVLPAPVGAWTTTSFPSRSRFTASCCHLSGMIRLTIGYNSSFFFPSPVLREPGTPSSAPCSTNPIHHYSVPPILYLPTILPPSSATVSWIKYAKKTKDEGAGCRFMNSQSQMSLVGEHPSPWGLRPEGRVGIPDAHCP